jgi:D-3-phosphoglycerate dehydrogenase
LAGKTVGIIGTGRIGMRLSELLRPFGVNVVGWSRTPREAFVQAGGRYMSSIAEVCAMSRVVSLHLALNGATRGIVGATELAQLGAKAWLVNVARGALVDERALFEALRAQTIGGAALDVYTHEPYVGDPPFHELSNVILLPHLGFRTEEALGERGRVTCSNIVAFCAGNPANLVA